AWALLPFLAPPFLVGVGYVSVVLWRARERERASETTAPATVAPTAPAEIDEAPTAVLPAHNPLGLASSIRMAVLFQVVLLAVAWLEQATGSAGLLATAGVLGLTNMDALTLSMARLGADPAMQQLAALAIAVGMIANSVLKLGLTLVLGTRAFQRRASLGLLALMIAGGVGVLLGQWLPTWLAGR